MWGRLEAAWRRCMDAKKKTVAHIEHYVKLVLSVFYRTVVKNCKKNAEDRDHAGWGHAGRIRSRGFLSHIRETRARLCEAVVILKSRLPAEALNSHAFL